MCPQVVSFIYVVTEVYIQSGTECDIVHSNTAKMFYLFAIYGISTRDFYERTPLDIIDMFLCVSSKEMQPVPVYGEIYFEINFNW